MAHLVIRANIHLASISGQEAHRLFASSLSPFGQPSRGLATPQHAAANGIALGMCAVDFAAAEAPKPAHRSGAGLARAVFSEVLFVDA